MSSMCVCVVHKQRSRKHKMKTQPVNMTRWPHKQNIIRLYLCSRPSSTRRFRIYIFGRVHNPPHPRWNHTRSVSPMQDFVLDEFHLLFFVVVVGHVCWTADCLFGGYGERARSNQTAATGRQRCDRKRAQRVLRYVHYVLSHKSNTPLKRIDTSFCAHCIHFIVLRFTLRVHVHAAGTTRHCANMPWWISFHESVSDAAVASL